LQYKNNLTDAVWNSLGSMAGNNSVESIRDPGSGSDRFYRIQIQ
jgi:hypothetical protein